MGFRETVLLGFVLLLSGGNPCAATQNWLNLSTNDTLTQIPQEQLTTSLQPPRSPPRTDLGSNWTEHEGLLRSPVTYRLKVHQIPIPAVRKPTPPQPPEEQMHTSQDPEQWEARLLTLEELDPEGTVQAQEALELAQESLILIQGPDLNPPIEPESMVPTLLFEQQVPVPADTVEVHCGEEGVTVDVKQNFLGNGQFIRPSDLTLGGCAALHTAHNILRFQSELESCGCTLRMTEEALIYSFSLLYSPTPIGNTFILKTNPAQVVVECHYERRVTVSSSGGMRPTWKPFLSSMLAEQRLQFSLRLMTEDWQSERLSSSYLMSEIIRIEAVALQGHHIPLRVYVDGCVATLSPDPSSVPRYPFIGNHGCFSDAKLTGAKSYFMPRSQEDTLHFQLRAFRFTHEHKNSLYITCRLRATQVSVAIDSQHKACSYLAEANRWVASGGDNRVCGCCETSCREHRQKRGLAADVELQWEGTVGLGPILLEESILLEDLTEHSQLQTYEVTRAASYPSTALLCGVGVALAALLLVVMGAIIRCRHHKPTKHFVST